MSNYEINYAEPARDQGFGQPGEVEKKTDLADEYDVDVKGEGHEGGGYDRRPSVLSTGEEIAAKQ